MEQYNTNETKDEHPVSMVQGSAYVLCGKLFLLFPQLFYYSLPFFRAEYKIWSLPYGSLSM